ncbi:hypothetical protein K440DRAFT_223437 [Wilcoxina mikolae CBS 423.85]|nr:hypothetical protein K440DRAFT_223437 [Wilcoxina mikolae CBS 423.85]
MGHVSIILCVAAYARATFALPINETEPVWVPAPKGRGTLGLVLPCLITLALCVWTAIHLNVNPEPTKTRQFFFKFAWLLMGVFAPEIVLWCSIDQYLEARAIRKAVLQSRKERFNMEPPRCTCFLHRLWTACIRCFRKDGSKDRSGSGQETLSLRLPDFSMESAFFVVMGGFVVHPGLGKFDGLPVTLTPKGFLALYTQGHIKEEDLDPKLITDKAKADGLAKMVVCAQAFWFVIQGIGRVASRLPIPLLELHTIMHVLCAVLMYWFWWYKPLDVRYPIVLSLQQDIAEEIYSFVEFLDDGRPLSPSNGTDAPDEGGSDEGIQQDPIQSVAPCSQNGAKQPLPAVAPNSRSRTSAGLQGTMCAPTYEFYQFSFPQNNLVPRLRRTWAIASQNLQLPVLATQLLMVVFPPLAYDFWHDSFKLCPPPGNDLTEIQTRIIGLARSRKRKTQSKNLSTSTVNGFKGEDGFQHIRARMLFHNDFTRKSKSEKALIILGALSIFYGGAHAAAWNSHLPTPVERLLWRISSVIAGSIVPFSLGLFIVGVILFRILQNLGERMTARFSKDHCILCKVGYHCGDFLEDEVERWILVALVVYLFCAAIAFIFGRVFLAVESFLSLRSLPRGSYEAVPWSNYWPHF